MLIASDAEFAELIKSKSLAGKKEEGWING